MVGPTCKRAGYSLIEVTLAIVFLGVVLAKASLVIDLSNAVVSRESSAMMMEDHARTVVARVASAIRSCDRHSLAPILNPGDSAEVNYQVSLGHEDGEIVWGAPERISISGPSGSLLVWSESNGTPDERSVVWSQSVTPLLQGEVENDVDDNGNGLIDERGLSFVVEGNLVTIRLSLGKAFVDGEFVWRSVERVVTIRNNPVAP